MNKTAGIMSALVLAAIGSTAVNVSPSQAQALECESRPVCGPLVNQPPKLPDYRATEVNSYFKSRFDLGNKCWNDWFGRDADALLRGNSCLVRLDSIGDAEGKIAARNFKLVFVDNRDGDDFFMRFKFDWVVVSDEAYECAATFCYPTKKKGEVWYSNEQIDIRYDVNQK